MAGFSLVLLSINVQKELGQYPAILISHLVTHTSHSSPFWAQCNIQNQNKLLYVNVFQFSWIITLCISNWRVQGDNASWYIWILETLQSFSLNKSKQQDVFALSPSIEQLWQGTCHLVILLQLSEILIIVYTNDPCAFFLVFSLLTQANETGGSSQMELEGAKRAFAYLISVGLKIAVFVSDRHRGIAKWLRECQPNTAHFFDIWHVARSIGKKMLTLSKQKGCERISQWIKGVRNHLHWCASSTKQGFKELIAAKWMSLMRHISNKHDNHQSHLFDKCAHRADIEKRKWIKIGTYY